MLYLKAYHAEAKIEDPKQGIVHAVISCYGNEDGDGDTMEAGAFKKSIDLMKGGGFRPVGLAYHDMRRPCAKTLDAWETPSEMHVVGQFNLDITDGKEVFSNIEKGVVSTYSHGFVRPKIQRTSEGKRRILDLGWKEWSPVPIPANLSTHTVAVKGLLRDGMTFADHSEMVLDAVEELLARSEEIAELRKAEGRIISQESRAVLKTLHERLASFLQAAEQVSQEDVAREMARYLGNRNKLRRALLAE